LASWHVCGPVGGAYPMFAGEATSTTSIRQPSKLLNNEVDT
jgi:hypothetical protein